MNTGPFFWPASVCRLLLLPDLFSDGEELIGMTADGGCKVVVGGCDTAAVEGGVVAGHVFFGEAGHVWPSYGVALAGQRGVPDKSKTHVVMLAFREVYKDVEGTCGAFAVASEVSGPSLLAPATPGGILAQFGEGSVARVALV